MAFGAVDGAPAQAYRSAVTHAPPSYAARYDDGSGPRPVVLRPAADALEIREADGSPVARWPYGRITLGDRVDEGIPLKCASDRKGALSVLDPGIVDVLRRHRKAPQGSQGGQRARKGSAPGAASAAPAGTAEAGPRRPLPGERHVRPAVLAAALFALGIGLYALVAVAGPPLAARFADRLPPPWRATWGAALATSAGLPCTEPAGREALESLAGRLDAAAGRVLSEVTVVDDPAVLARSLPGGHLLLTRGLIEAARSPDEMAGILAHAIADARALGPERTLLSHLRPAELVTLWQDGQETPPALLSRALARSQPRPGDLAATDAAALALLGEAGLRQRGLAGFHDVLTSRAAAEARAPLYLRDHPMDASRMDRLRAVPPGGSQALPADRWQALKGICGQDREREPVGSTG